MKSITKNKKAYFDFEIIETFEAGIALKGSEIKSIRLGQVNLKDSYCRFNKDGELVLVNCHISHYKFSHKIEILDEKRSRVLLLHKKQLQKLQKEIKLSGYSIVVTKMYFQRNFVKVEVGLAKGKKNHDKRQVIKQRDLKRESDKFIKNYY